jgi:hypothetical protein
MHRSFYLIVLICHRDIGPSIVLVKILKYRFQYTCGEYLHSACGMRLHMQISVRSDIYGQIIRIIVLYYNFETQYI